MDVLEKRKYLASVGSSSVLHIHYTEYAVSAPVALLYVITL